MAELTAEEKAKRAEKARAARQAKKAAAEAEAAEIKNEKIVEEPKQEAPAFTEEDYKKLLMENERMKQELKVKDEKFESMNSRMNELESLIMQSKNNVVQVQASVPVVKLRFQSECSDHNVVNFGVNGKFGSITGKSGTFSVTKEAFGGEFRDALVQSLLASRELIVLDGLTDEERELYGVNYKKGEVLEEKVFRKITSMGKEILDIYDDLCESHKIMLARRYMEEFERNPKKVDRSIIVELNERSKAEYKNLPDGDPKKKGLFIAVLEAMNKHDAES